MKKLLGVLLMVVFTLLLLEAGAWIYLSVLGDLSRSDLVRVKKKHVNIVIAGKNPGDVRFWNNQKLRLHPYSSYTLEPFSKKGINNAGMISEKSYPHVASRSTLVVGLFGGSVAWNIFFHIDRVRQKQLERMLLLHIGDKGYDSVEFLNFTLGGYKQPIDLFNLIYYLNTVDLAIFIEGFNEIHQFVSNVQKNGLPGDFPKANYWRALAEGNFSTTELGYIGKLTINRERQNQITAIALLPGLDRSMLVHMVWRATTAALMSSASRTRAQLEQHDRPPQVYPQVTGDDDPEAVAVAFIEKYRSYIRSADAVGRASGILTLFVVQPNQYVPNSKPLSDQEKSEFLTNKNLLEIIPEWYPRIRTLYRELGAEGIFTLDLTEAFSDVEETTYSDECCHLNALGRKVVTDAIFEAIVSRKGYLDSLLRAEMRGRTELR